MTEAAEAAAGMEIDTNDGTVADASMLPPGQGQARTTCQKWRALLGLAACDLMLSADTSMARRLTQGTALSKRGRPRAPRASGQPLRSSMLPRASASGTHARQAHTLMCAIDRL